MFYSAACLAADCVPVLVALTSAAFYLVTSPAAAALCNIWKLSKLFGTIETHLPLFRQKKEEIIHPSFRKYNDFSDTRNPFRKIHPAHQVSPTPSLHKNHIKISVKMNILHSPPLFLKKLIFFSSTFRFTTHFFTPIGHKRVSLHNQFTTLVRTLYAKNQNYV